MSFEKIKVGDRVLFEYPTCGVNFKGTLETVVTVVKPDYFKCDGARFDLKTGNRQPEKVFKEHRVVKILD